MNDAQHHEMLAFFRVLADANRLKIVGLLSQRSPGEGYSVEELAGLLGLGASTVSHHLSRLAEVGLVSARAEGYYNIYSLQKGVIETMARRLLSGEVLPQAARTVDPEAYDDKVWKDYIQENGRLKSIPSQRKKREAILRRLLREFQPGVEYTEKQVNEILGKYHWDTATLRREMIGCKMLDRTTNGSAYWRI